jgi:glutamine amidotransferase
MIAIVDYGMGNLSSIQNMLKRVGQESLITDQAEELRKADKIILPGVGAFDSAIQRLHNKGIWEILNQKALTEQIPILGICLGMQLFANSSEEGVLPGLGWIDAEVKKFRFEPYSKLKIPHVGWNNVTIQAPRHTIFEKALPQQRFYFAHGYHIVCRSNNESIASSHYGYDFTCAVAKGNIIGVQFHLEKSHAFGMNLLKCFCLI